MLSFGDTIPPHAIVGRTPFKEAGIMKYTGLLFVVVLLLMPIAALAQGGNSTVRGSVHDQARAIIPGAKVSFTNTATNVTRESLTNEAGLYVFPGVIPGSYRVTVEFPGL